MSDLWVYALKPLEVEREAKLIADKRGDIVVAHGAFLALQPKSEGSNTSPNLVSAWPWRVAGDLMSQSGRHSAMGRQLAEIIDAQKGLL